MKTRGLMLIAFLCSGTVFAQNANVKTEQTASVKVQARSDKEAATVKGNAVMKSDIAAENEAATVKGNAAVKSDIAAENEVSAIKGEASAIKDAAFETGQQSAVHISQGIKSTLNTTAGMSGSLLKTTSLKIAPVKINTQIISRTGLFIR